MGTQNDKESDKVAVSTFASLVTNFIPQLVITFLVYCVLYPACNVHVPYCSLWPAPTLQYFATLPHKQDNLQNKKKRVIEKGNVCFDFL